MATEFITSVRETDVGILLDILHARLNEAHITTLNELLACWSTWLTDPPLHFARVSQLACNSYFRSLLARAANAELPLAEMVRVPTHLNPLASYLVAIYDVRFGFIFPSEYFQRPYVLDHHRKPRLSSTYVDFQRTERLRMKATMCAETDREAQ
ncbi:hypothetical protein BST61_g9163 [Cercospora zeina]